MRARHSLQVASPHFAQLFTFDIPDPAGEAIVFKVKHDRQFSPANREQLGGLQHAGHLADGEGGHLD